VKVIMTPPQGLDKLIKALNLNIALLAKSLAEWI